MKKLKLNLDELAFCSFGSSPPRTAYADTIADSLLHDVWGKRVSKVAATAFGVVHGIIAKVVDSTHPLSRPVANTCAGVFTINVSYPRKWPLGSAQADDTANAFNAHRGGIRTVCEEA